MTDETVAVEQCDRQAALSTVPDDGSHSSYMMAEAIEAGRADEWPLVQAFARHRIAALASARELVEVWHPITTLTDQRRCGGPLNLYDPAFDKSADNFGASWDGYWNDGDGTDDPETGGHWVAAVWCNDHDEWHPTRINPTHYREPPLPPGAATIVHPRPALDREALKDMCAAMEYWAGCDEGVTPDIATSEIMSAGGAWPANAYNKARSILATPPAALDREAFPRPQRRDGKAPCGECRLPVGETCDICGARQ